MAVVTLTSTSVEQYTILEYDTGVFKKAEQSSNTHRLHRIAAILLSKEGIN